MAVYSSPLKLSANVERRRALCVPPDASRARVYQDHAREEPQGIVPCVQRTQGAAGPIGLTEKLNMARLGQIERPVADAMGQRLVSWNLVVDTVRRRGVWWRSVWRRSVGVGHGVFGRYPREQRKVHEQQERVANMPVERQPRAESVRSSGVASLLYIAQPWLGRIEIGGHTAGGSAAALGGRLAIT